MKNSYTPREIPLVSAPVTSKNRRNKDSNPSIWLGITTPSQLIEYAGIDREGTICVLGNHKRSISLATALIRRSGKPFLIIGPESDKESALTVLAPEWTLNAPQSQLPSGNGALFLSKPYASYMELCEYFRSWAEEYFIILHLNGGVGIGPELLNIINSSPQCLILADSLPKAVRNSENRAVTPKEVMSQMSYLLVCSAGVATKELVEVLPTYQYEKISNNINLNRFSGHSLFNPFRTRRNYGVSVGQTRTMEYKKSLFEMDELQRIFDDGTSLLYDANKNIVFLAQVI